MQVEIQLNHLKAARCFSAKKDLRCYLEGVALKNGYLVGTTGSIIGAIRCSALDNLTEIIIPNQALDFFFKKASGYRTPEASVSVEWDGDRKGTLRIGSDVEHFVGLDGVFPDFLRIVPTHDTPRGFPQFDWDLMQPFQKAAAALGVSARAAVKALLIPNGEEGTARVVIPDHPDFIGGISPLRPSFYANALKGVAA